MFGSMNAPTALAEGLPRRRFSVADVVRMAEVGLIGEDERLEVLDGEIVPMSPKGSRHETIKGALNELWGRRCPSAFRYVPQTGLYLDDRTYLEPDFVVFPRKVAIPDLRGPDVLLAVEVADSSLPYDLHRKPTIYAAYGVHELWVIDVRRRVVHVHDTIGAEGYVSVVMRGPDERLIPTLAPAELAVSLAELEAV
jgi:Uma2 family endonuclease